MNENTTPRNCLENGVCNDETALFESYETMLGDKLVLVLGNRSLVFSHRRHSCVIGEWEYINFVQK